LAYLPITIGESGIDCCLDLWTGKWSESENGASSHRRFVFARPEDCGHPTLVSNRSESGSACLANKLVIVVCRE
jgi:hypothetical protein